MKKVLSMMSFGLMLSLFACGGPEGELDFEPIDDSQLAETEAELGSYGLTRQQLRQLTRARAATARYNYLPNALADGFVDTGLPCFDGQGYHYIRPDRLNTYNPTEPAILVYSPTNRLVALEWATPVDAVGGVRPVMFGETFHGPVLDPPLYVLHAWVWYYNSDGVFDDAAPDISCP